MAWHKLPHSGLSWDSYEGWDEEDMDGIVCDSCGEVITEIDGGCYVGEVLDEWKHFCERCADEIESSERDKALEREAFREKLKFHEFLRLGAEC